MNKLKFSVLMPIYYKEIPEYLEKSLKSITENQDLKPDQIVIVKDGPLTGKLDEILNIFKERYPSLLKIISLEKNYGLGYALNEGLKNCDYELVARMDADDISNPNRFKKQIDIFKNNENVSIVGSWVDEFIEEKEDIKIKYVRKVPENSKEIHKKLMTICAFNHPTVMYKKSEILKVGSYLQEFALEDYYLWIRLALNGAEMYNIQESLLKFRVTKYTAQRRGGFKLLKSDIKFQKKILELEFIGFPKFIYNILIYGSYRIIPWKLRALLQKKIFRNKKK